MESFIRVQTPLSGVIRIERKEIRDERGSFRRLFDDDGLGDLLGGSSIVQINHSVTREAGTIRGMHYQRAPQAETKIVGCVRGVVYDVVVDVREGSPTFLQWHGETLSATDGASLVVPPGCAHGFQALTDDCELIYLHTAAFAPTAECALDAAEARVGIQWPLPIGMRSERDRNHPALTAAFNGVPV